MNERMVLPLPALLTEVRERLLPLALEVVAERGRFVFCLTGGSTPQALYASMSQPPFVQAFPWDKTDWFLSDERGVPADHAESNARMIREALFAPVGVSNERVYLATHPEETERSAEAYNHELEGVTFDALLLGVGEDGHVASLFPGQDPPRDRLAFAATNPSGQPRISITWPMIERARKIFVLMTGTRKRDIAQRLFSQLPPDVPAARLLALPQTTWFLDAETGA